MDTGQTCEVCQSNKFFEENGNYWCLECNTMSQQVTAVLVDQTGPVPNDVDLDDDMEHTDDTFSGHEGGKVLTSFELLTKVLRGLALELIDLGVTPELYKVSKVLWLTYMKKCGLILNEHKQPVLPAMIKERDVEILYGVQGVSRKKIITGSGRKAKKEKLSQASPTTRFNQKRRQKNLMQQFMLEEEGNEETLQAIQSPWSTPQSSRNSSEYETDEEKIRDIKLVKGSEKFLKKSRQTFTKRDLKKPRHIDSINADAAINTKKFHIGSVEVLANLWLGIQYTGSSHLQLGDLYRLVSDGYLNLDNLERFVPKEYRNYKSFRYWFKSITRRSFLLRCGSTCTLLGMTHIRTCDIRILIRIYVAELALPEDILQVTDSICSISSPPSSRLVLIERLMPEYDLIAMAVILVALKVLLGLDDATEVELSNVAREINSKQDPSARRQFEFTSWFEHIKCRNAMIASNHNSTFESTYTRLMSHRLATHSFLTYGMKNDRKITRNLPGDSKRLKSCLQTGLISKDKLLKTKPGFKDIDTPLKPLLAVQADEVYLPQWSRIILDQSQNINPKTRDILGQDFSKSSLDFLDPSTFTDLCKQLGVTSEIHEGRSPRSTVYNKVPIKLFVVHTNTRLNKSHVVLANVSRNPMDINEEEDPVDVLLAQETIFCEEDYSASSKSKHSGTQRKDCNKLTLYIPRHDYWTLHHCTILSQHGTRYKYSFKQSRRLNQGIASLCSVNFLALLNLCSSIVRSQPYHVFGSMCLLEYELIHGVLPEKSKFWMRLVTESKNKGSKKTESYVEDEDGLENEEEFEDFDV